jgi:translation initiation factor 1 (eIF-1/SUI1)
MESQQDILNLIDRRVKLRFMKEKKASRTYIEGLEKFFDVETIKTLTKVIQKNLSTGYTCKTDDSTGVIGHGYNGDHKERIKQLLITKYNIPEDKIIMCS